MARATRPDDATNVNQMMLALLKQNPNAFYKDNINALKRGAILRIPSGDEVKATGRPALRQRRCTNKIEDWRGGAAVAETDASIAECARTAEPNAGASHDDSSHRAKNRANISRWCRRAGKDRSGDGRPSRTVGRHGSKRRAQAELARTKEALTSREQEAGRTKSRVKELEELKGKNDRLISLKESEIADLQTKLKELQPASPPPRRSAPRARATAPLRDHADCRRLPQRAANATEPAATSPKPADTAGKTRPKIDGTGYLGRLERDAAMPRRNRASRPTPPATTTPATHADDDRAAAATTASDDPRHAAAGSTTDAARRHGIDSRNSTRTTVRPRQPRRPHATTPRVRPDADDDPDDQRAGQHDCHTTADRDTTPPKAAGATPKPARRLPLEQPWYQQTGYKPARGRRAACCWSACSRCCVSCASRKPVADAGRTRRCADPYARHVRRRREHHLLDALAQHPGRSAPVAGTAQPVLRRARCGEIRGCRAKRCMRISRIRHQPEWQQAQAMGEELRPHNPLFAAMTALRRATTAATKTHTRVRTIRAASGARRGWFDLGDHASTRSAAPVGRRRFRLRPRPTSRRRARRSHEMPVRADEVDARSTTAAAATGNGARAGRTRRRACRPTPAPCRSPTDDFFAGEDAIGTKLDLAKAYLDMGDPEGARSMLEEVVAEGNDAQKGEARRLIAEIR